MQEQEKSTSRQNNQPASGSDSNKQQECSVSPSNSHTGATSGGEGTAEPATEPQVLEDDVSQLNSADSDASSDKTGVAHVPAAGQTAATDVTGMYLDVDEVASASTADEADPTAGEAVPSASKAVPTAGKAVPTAGVHSSTAVDSSSTSEVATTDEACTASVNMDLPDRGHLPAVVCCASSGEHVREANSMQSSPIFGVATASSQAFTPTQRNPLAQNAKQGVHRLEIESSPQLYFGCMAWYISWRLASCPLHLPPPPSPSSLPPPSPPKLQTSPSLPLTSLLPFHHLCFPEGKLCCQTSGSSCTRFACVMLSL